MRNNLARTLAVLILLGVLGSRAQAQTLYGNINQPPVSPYINILRGGAPAGVNYYNIVQPQLQFYSAINQLQQQQQYQAAALTSPQGYLTTGHPIQFANLSHFYPQGGLSSRGSSSALGPQGLYNLQMRLQQNLPTRSLGTAQTNVPVRSR